MQKAPDPSAARQTLPHRTSGINLKLEQPPFGKFHFRDLPTFQPKSHFQRSHVPSPEGTNHIKNTTAANKIPETTRATGTHGPLLILFAFTSHCAQASSCWGHSFKSQRVARVPSTALTDDLSIKHYPGIIIDMKVLAIAFVDPRQPRTILASSERRFTEQVLSTHVWVFLNVDDLFLQVTTRSTVNVHDSIVCICSSWTERVAAQLRGGPISIAPVQLSSRALPQSQRSAQQLRWR